MKLSEEQLLERKLWRAFSKGVTRYGLLQDGDHVLVGLSGGKDSLALLQLMAKRARIFRPGIKVSALHVRMKNIDYQSDTHYLEEFARQEGIELIVRETGFDATTDTRKSPCFLCSWNRRKMMFAVAQELGCNKIALGHHQDDILHTMLMNITFQGQFATMPVKLTMRKFAMTIIRPLCMIEEADLVRWAQFRHYEKQLKQCPYEHDSHRTQVAHLFADIEKMSSQARYSMWNALESQNKLIEE